MLKHLLYLWAKHAPLPRTRQPHTLSGSLVVSVTSHAPRFKTLSATLRSLLAQTVAPDRTILWVGHADRAKVPNDVEILQDHGLAICSTDDIGPYTKIIPALRRYPDAFVATADDDVFYDPTWLAGLVDGFAGNYREIVCRRARKIRLDRHGLPLPYLQWDMTDCRTRSTFIFPNGLGGVLYPPGCFHDDVTDDSIFLDIAPKADDIWLYWMARLNGCQFRSIGKSRLLKNWPGSQARSLWLTNKQDVGGNDDQMRQLAERYGGLPPEKWSSLKYGF